jgi:NADPH-dependent ferric siderophore reductase
MAASQDQDMSAAAARRRFSDRFMLQATIVAVEQISRSMRLIRLDTGGISALECVPGQQVRVQVGGGSGAVDRLVGQLRTYSVWELAADHLDLVVLDHGERAGPGAAWSRAVEPGQVVRFIKPQGTFVLRQSSTDHVFIGEETAAVAFGAMLRALQSGQRGLAVVEVDDPADQLPLPGEVHWHYRLGGSAAGSASLVETVRQADLPSSGVAYLAGEARTIQLVRKHLVDERGWSRRDVLTKPFWTPGKKGME